MLRRARRVDRPRRGAEPRARGGRRDRRRRRGADHGRRTARRRADRRDARALRDGGRAPGCARPAGRTRGAAGDLDVVRVRAEGEDADGEAIRSGVAVPLPGETAQLGLLTIFTRADPAELRRGAGLELEELALRAGPAIENARRFREARQLADLDALTGLHNRRYFHETLAREVARAHRYNRNLALIIFDLDDFKAINDRIGHLSGDARPGRGSRARPRGRALGGHRVPRRRRRVRGHPSGVAAQGRGSALRAAANRTLVEARRPGWPADDVGRRRRASAGRRRDRVLPAGRPRRSTARRRRARARSWQRA